MSQKLHYYCLTFYDVQGRTSSHASAYYGYQGQYVTLGNIEIAKQGAGVSADATLLACSYLGYMTTEEFRSN